MRRLWMRWVALGVFVAVLATAFVRLGEWQLHRLEQRRQTNARIVAHQAGPVRPWHEVVAGQVTDEMQWQRVTATGTFDAAHTITVRYRNIGDGPGSEVLTPLRTSRGIVLVDRGFLPKPRDASEATNPAPPPGTVTVVGWLRRSEVGKDNAIRPVEGNVRLINAPAVGQWLGEPVSDGYLQAIRTQPADAARLQPVPIPPLDEGPHLSYAVQWFLFTVIAVGGAVVLVRGDLRDRRRAAARGAAAAAPTATQPPDAPSGTEDDQPSSSGRPPAGDHLPATSSHQE